jgi:hypothetical protein
VFRRRVSACTRMKNADWLDVVACRFPCDSTATENDSCESAVRSSVYTLRRLNNDRWVFSRLSKIAHREGVHGLQRAAGLHHEMALGAEARDKSHAADTNLPYLNMDSAGTGKLDLYL